MSERVSDERLAQTLDELGVALLVGDKPRVSKEECNDAARRLRELAAARAELAEALGVLREARSEGWYADDDGWKRVDALLRKVGM